MTDSSEASDATSYVPLCAIGASAGGIVALQNFFRHVSPDLGLAYVVVVHLAPHQPSALSEILAACTRMPVRQVHDSPSLQPNCVLVIPPDRKLTIEGDEVTARPFDEPQRGERGSIDLFFRSIAEARGDGVAIIMSGSGHDGAFGVRAIKEAGGMVMVQDPAEAEFGSMPQSAIDTGAVDVIATVARLAERLREVALSKEAVRSLDMDKSAKDLRRIVAYVRSRTGHDFSGYKRATIMRRVVRRLQVCRVESLPAYVDYLRNTPEETEKLFADLLISVTQFFRDARAFEALERQAIQPIFEKLKGFGDEGVRAWVVGCATGEEAYSIAIVLLEEAARRELTVPIQVFATDLDEAALASAREGRYPRSISQDISEARLARFFLDEGTHFRVRKEVRDAVLFAAHSILKEPPFMRLDLVSCRNLMIYLERSLQQQLCAVFHYSLKDGRFLFLGSAETPDHGGGLFVTVDRDCRIYASRPHALESLPILPQFPGPERLAAPRYSPPAHERGPLPVSLHAAALEHAAPPSVLVDSGQNIVHLSPMAGRYILHSAGPVSRLLPAIVRPELRLDLKLALDRAINRRESSLSHPTVVSFDGEPHRVAVHVLPMTTDDRNSVQAMVFFLDAGAVQEDSEEDEHARPAEVRRLYAELKVTQEALVVSRGGHEVTIQDLRAANEELQSTNEEYRSTAEELETSREELQSINEELHTVNAELKSKLEYLSAAHNDLQNLTAATEIGTLFLDAELNIKMFTPPIAQLFNITGQDVGRALTHFTHQLDYAGLVPDAREVLRELAPLEREVRSAADHWYVMRMRPYRTVENRIEGIVLTFVDISGRLRAEAALSRSEEQFRALVQASSQVLYRMSPAWDDMREVTGGGLLASPHNPRQSWLEHYVPAEDRSALQAEIRRAVEGQSLFDVEHRVVRTDGSVGWLHSRAIPLLDTDGTILEWFGSGNDVTVRRRAEESLRESEDRLRVLIEGMPQLVWRAATAGRWTWSSPQWHRYTGQSDEQSREFGWLAAVHPDDRDELMLAWHRVSPSDGFEVECRLQRMGTGVYRWFRGRAAPLLDGRRQVVEWLGTFTDVNDLRVLHERQRVLLAELQHRVRNLLAVMRAVATRTSESSETVEEFSFHLQGRLGALARTQVLLTRQPGQGVPLEAMVREELLAQAPEAERVLIAGPSVLLPPKAAEVLSLAVHELVTNAVKYGALTAGGGQIDISWRTYVQSEMSWLRFEWVESSVAMPAARSVRRGFGSELIEERVPYELKGRGTLEFGNDGTRCVITFPLREGESILQTGAGSR